MKRCVRCSREYPDDARFCSVDGVELTERRATASKDTKAACAICGGRSWTAEDTCAFCHTPRVAGHPGIAPARSTATGADATNLNNQSAPARKTASRSFPIMIGLLAGA